MLLLPKRKKDGQLTAKSTSSNDPEQPLDDVVGPRWLEREDPSHKESKDVIEVSKQQDTAPNCCEKNTSNCFGNSKAEPSFCGEKDEPSSCCTKNNTSGCCAMIADVSD